LIVIATGKLSWQALAHFLAVRDLLRKHAPPGFERPVRR
jgi:hypothetical protein